MGEYSYEALRAAAIARGEERYMYEPIDEQLTNPSVFVALPDFYVSHVEEKNARVRALLAAHPNHEAFVFFADAHVRQNRMYSVPIVRSILSQTEVKTVIYGGDTVSAWVDEHTMEEDVLYFARAFAFAKPYMVRGNHDIYGKLFGYAGSGAVKSADEVYDLILRENASRVCGEVGKNYYWFDHVGTRTRYVVIDTNEILTPFTDRDGVWDCNVHVTQEQVDWFVEQLQAIPRDYVAVVIGHIPVFRQLRHAYEGALVFGDLIEAFNGRRRIDKSYGANEARLRACADFGGAEARVVLTLSGHGHFDDLYVSSDGCVNLEIHCDAMTDNGGSPYKKVRGTVTENALDVVILDRDSGDVYTVRYGAGVDRFVKKRGADLSMGENASIR